MKNVNLKTILFYIIIFFLIIGIVSRITTDLSAFIIPVLVLGTIFLLYKFPPSQWKIRKRNKRKVHHLRVIQGKKNKGGNEPPPYH